MIRTLLTLALFTSAAATAGIPEPSIVFYGRVTVSPPNTAYTPAAVAWTLNGNAEALTVSQTQVIVVNTETFYISRVPFETRKLADNTPIPATANTLGLSATDVNYTRTATVDTRPAILPSGTGTFNYGATNQGLIESLDLVIGETFAEWSQRVFGTLVNPNDDADGDGQTNYQEYLAGTDPNSATSRLFVKSLALAAGGGIVFSWDTISGKTTPSSVRLTSRHGPPSNRTSPAPAPSRHSPIRTPPQTRSSSTGWR